MPPIDVEPACLLQRAARRRGTNVSNADRPAVARKYAKSNRIGWQPASTPAGDEQLGRPALGCHARHARKDSGHRGAPAPAVSFVPHRLNVVVAAPARIVGTHHATVGPLRKFAQRHRSHDAHVGSAPVCAGPQNRGGGGWGGQGAVATSPIDREWWSGAFIFGRRSRPGRPPN